MSQKIEMCTQELKSVAADRMVLSALDEASIYDKSGLEVSPHGPLSHGSCGRHARTLVQVAWMLNIRGSDVHCNPVAISYLTVDKSGAVHWFIHANKVSDTANTIHSYD